MEKEAVSVDLYEELAAIRRFGGSGWWSLVIGQWAVGSGQWELGTGNCAIQA
jgi:hypothetical protein